MDKMEKNSLKCRRRERRPYCRYRDRRAVRGELAELRLFAYEKALKEKGVECETRIIHGAAHAFILFDYRRDNKFVAETLQDIIKCMKGKDLI